MYTIATTLKTVDDFKKAAAKEFGNTPFTRKQAIKICQIAEGTDRWGCGHDAQFIDTTGNRLSIGTILTYLDIHHKEKVEGGTRYELYGIRVPVSKYENFPPSVKAMCEKITWDSGFERNYYCLTDKKTDVKIAEARQLTATTIRRKREKIAALQREIGEYEQILKF